MSNQMFSSKGGAVQGLPPPPSKQSIKAANASKLKGIKTATSENSQCKYLSCHFNLSKPCSNLVASRRLFHLLDMQHMVATMALNV